MKSSRWSPGIEPVPHSIPADSCGLFSLFQLRKKKKKERKAQLGYVHSRIHFGLIIMLILDAVLKFLKHVSPSNFRSTARQSLTSYADVDFMCFYFSCFICLISLYIYWGSYLPEIRSRNMENRVQAFCKYGRQLYTYFMSVNY